MASLLAPSRSSAALEDSETHRRQLGRAPPPRNRKCESGEFSRERCTNPDPLRVCMAESGHPAGSHAPLGPTPRQWTGRRDSERRDIPGQCQDPARLSERPLILGRIGLHSHGLGGGGGGDSHIDLFPAGSCTTRDGRAGLPGAVPTAEAPRGERSAPADRRCKIRVKYIRASGPASPAWGRAARGVRGPRRRGSPWGPPGPGAPGRGPRCKIRVAVKASIRTLRSGRCLHPVCSARAENTGRPAGRPGRPSTGPPGSWRRVVRPGSRSLLSVQAIMMPGATESQRRSPDRLETAHGSDSRTRRLSRVVAHRSGARAAGGAAGEAREAGCRACMGATRTESESRSQSPGGGPAWCLAGVSLSLQQRRQREPR